MDHLLSIQNFDIERVSIFRRAARQTEWSVPMTDYRDGWRSRKSPHLVSDTKQRTTLHKTDLSGGFVVT